MNRYVKCVNHKQYIHFKGEPLSDAPIYGLEIGQVYKVAPPEENDGREELRVIDASGEDYLYPAIYFEPLAISSDSRADATITIHLPQWLKGMLHAEAIVAGKSISTLARQWLAERLDLPTT
jgi:hypothetical protein